jgi:membrane protease YdiL (CAAX protease family)
VDIMSTVCTLGTMCAADGPLGPVPFSAPQTPAGQPGEGVPAPGPTDPLFNRPPSDPLFNRPPSDSAGARVWFGMAVGGFAAGYLASAVLLTVFAAASGNLKDLSHLEGLSVPPWWVTIAGLAGLWMGFLGAIFLASRTRGSGNPAADMGFRISRWDAPVGIAIGIAGQLVVDLLYLPFEHVVPGLQHELNAPANRLTGGFHGPDLAVIGVLTVVVVPVVEELFFRGLLLQSLVRMFRGVGSRLGPVLAILSTGILFGLAHAEPVQLAGLALFGVVLSVMAYRTGRLGPSMFAHAAFNGFAVVVVAFQGRITIV